MSRSWVETIDGWLLAIEKSLRRLYSREEEPAKRGKWGYQPPRPDSPMSFRRGSRGGRYTLARTKDGRPYRRYF